MQFAEVATVTFEKVSTVYRTKTTAREAVPWFLRGTMMWYLVGSGGTTSPMLSGESTTIPFYIISFMFALTVGDLNDSGLILCTATAFLSGVTGSST